MKTIYISPKVIEWDSAWESLGRPPQQSTRLAYNTWKHAESLLKSTPDKFSRIDIIMTLKRACDIRLKQLERIYHFSRVPLKKYPKQRIQQLEYWGIVRSKLVQNLLNLRNFVEHQHKTPSVAECEKYLEFSWYFLKATDGKTFTKADNLTLSDLRHSFSYWLAVENIPCGPFEIHGWLPFKMVDLAGINKQWIAFKAKKITTREKKLKLIKNRVDRKEEEQYGECGVNPNDYYISGKLDKHNSDEIIIRIGQLYFDTF